MVSYLFIREKANLEEENVCVCVCVLEVRTLLSVKIKGFTKIHA